MLPNRKFICLNLIILCSSYGLIFGLLDDTFADEDLQSDLSSVMDVRRTILQATRRNPEIHRAVKPVDIPPVYVIDSPSVLNDQCDLDLKYLLETLIDPGPGGDRSWALKLVDSFGKPPPGFLRGQVNWPGSYDECLDVTAPGLNASSSGFHGRYAWLAFPLPANKSMIQPVSINVGACFPDSCSESDILELYNSTVQVLDKVWFLKEIVSKLPNPPGVKFVEDSYPLSKASVACICICALFAAAVLAGTAVDIAKRWKERRMFSSQSSVRDELSHLEDADASCINSSNSDVTDSSDPTKLVVIAQHNPKSIPRDFLLCFSAISNAESILNTESEGQLLCVHGIRFLSMAWVILGHTYYFGLYMFGNILDLLEKVDTWQIQVILQGTFSVDTFFLLSGCLLTYHFLRNKDKFTGFKNWILFYVHRYIRLTPVYAMVVFILATWWSNVGNGPFWSTQISDTCSKSWWWHLLYINNFMDALNMCVGWAWYLANDMQFYVISPLFLLAFKRNRVAGLVVVSVLLVASWIATGIISNVYDIPVTFANMQDTTDDDLAQKESDMFDKLYDKPYTRVGPYLIGVLLGCLLDMKHGQQKFLHKYLVIAGWASSQALSLLLVYGLYHTHIGPTTQYAYNTLARSAWGISVGWVIFACLTGHAGPANTLLSWKVWIPLSRLTYCAYLVHPMVMMWYMGTLRTTIYFSTSQIVIFYLSFMVLSYGVAFIASLMFEGPIMKLEKFIKNL